MRHFYQSPSPSDIVFYFAIIGRAFRDKPGLAGMSDFHLRVGWTAGDMEQEENMNEQENPMRHIKKETQWRIAEPRVRVSNSMLAALGEKLMRCFVRQSFVLQTRVAYLLQKGQSMFRNGSRPFNQIVNRSWRALCVGALALLIVPVANAGINGPTTIPEHPPEGRWLYNASAYPSTSPLGACQAGIANIPDGPWMVAADPVGDGYFCYIKDPGDEQALWTYAGNAVFGYLCIETSYYENGACWCATSLEYDTNVEKCVTVEKVGNVASDPKGNGESCPKCGNPINPGNGNKFQRETDYVAPASAGGLSLIRSYNGSHFSPDSAAVRSFGRRWTHRYDARVTFIPKKGSIACYRRVSNGVLFCRRESVDGQQGVSVVRGDGKNYTFTRNGSSWVNDADVNDRISATYAADGITILGWMYVSSSGDETERYDANGKLLSIESRAGAIQRMTYSNGLINDTRSGRYPADAPACNNIQGGAPVPAGLLMCVTDNWGRQLHFEYNALGLVNKVIDPAGQIYSYAYDGPSAGCTAAGTSDPRCTALNLTQVTYPDGTTRIYHYNEASKINNGNVCAGITPIDNRSGHLYNSLTGITDENRVRFATWTYDCTGRATSSEHAGGIEKVVITYGVLGTDINATVTHFTGDVANPQTVSSRYNYQILNGVAKNTGFSQSCPGCGNVAARSVDRNGNTTISRDWRGYSTMYTYDLARNLETSRSEGAGAGETRETAAEWHPTFRLPARIAEPRRITSYAYDQKGNLLAKTVQPTNDMDGSRRFTATAAGTASTWRYTYNEVGQVLTATDPRGNVTTYAYDAQGSLATVTNAAGHVTTLLNYDQHGRAGRIVDPNGLVTEMTYNLRGWLTTSTIGGETTNYEYDGIGQLKKVTMPDGSFVTYTYDDAHRLTGMSDSAGNSVTYVLDTLGNRIREEVRDPHDALVRQVARVYDALSRLKQVTGGIQ